DRQLAGDALGRRYRRPAGAARWRRGRSRAGRVARRRRRLAPSHGVTHLVLPFWLSIGVLSSVQAALVAAPRPALSALLGGLRSRWWALALPLPLGLGIAAIALSSASAHFFTYLALIAVPPLAAVALGWVMLGGRPWLALLAVPLFILAWAARGSLSGEAAAL